jgi:hypothetical protein
MFKYVVAQLRKVHTQQQQHCPVMLMVLTAPQDR